MRIVDCSGDCSVEAGMMRRMNSALIVGLVGMASIGGTSQLNPIVIHAQPRFDDMSGSIASIRDHKSSKRRRSRHEVRGW